MSCKVTLNLEFYIRGIGSNNMLEVGSKSVSIRKLVKIGFCTHTHVWEPELESTTLDYSATVTVGWVGCGTRLNLEFVYNWDSNRISFVKLVSIRKLVRSGIWAHAFENQNLSMVPKTTRPPSLFVERVVEPLSILYLYWGSKTCQEWDLNARYLSSLVP